jgi:hypothetical protein
MGIDKIGAQRDRIPIMSFGVRMPAHSFERRGEIKMRYRRFRSGPQDQLELHDGFIQAPHRSQSACEIRAGFGITGIERYGPLEASHGLSQLSGGGENHAPVVMGLGKRWIEQHGTSHQRCGVRAPKLMSDHAEQVKRMRVRGIGVAGKPVKPLGLRQTAGAMLRQRGCEP